ncbi:hypothetical protein [Streptomyces sp. NPDC090112]|uniref:hypothetical protein n=1 Tax=Streptomyces sp. NPDC090112 TaxID=3365949 RepID=UPI00380D4912
MIRRFRRRGHAPGTLSPENQAVVDQFRATLAAVRPPEPWTPGSGQDVAVRIGPFIERAHPRPGDDHGTEVIAIALVHPDAAAHLHGHQLGYTDRGWLRCETTMILGAWQPAYAMLTHAAANLPLPDDLGMSPAHYGVHVEARRPDGTSYSLLRLGPYTQTWLASRDADRLNAHVAGRAATVLSGFTVAAQGDTFDFNSVDRYISPRGADVTALLAAAVAGASALPQQLPRPNSRRPGIPRSAGCRAFLRFRGPRVSDALSEGAIAGIAVALLSTLFLRSPVRQ